MAPSPLLLLLLHLVVVCFFPVSTTQPVLDLSMDPSEHRALPSIMTALLPDPAWPVLHPRPCTDTPWPGLQCETIPGDSFLHVTRLIFAAPCNPSATLPPSLLLLLPHLRYLSVLSCLTTPNPLPASFFPPSSPLRHLLLLSNPGLSGPIPASISRLASLRVLRLSQNSLLGPLPDTLGLLPNLQQLDLSYNRLSGDIPDSISNLSSLVVLDLSHNNLSGSIPVSIGLLSSLQKLDLSSNSLTGVVPLTIGRCAVLELLDLSGNRIHGPLPGTLSELNKTLGYMIMEGNPIGTPMPAFVVALRRLWVLGLSRCGLSGRIPEELSELTMLTALELDGNRLTGPVPPALGRLPRLGVLNLSGNMLTGEVGLGVDFVRRLGRRLDLRGNRGLCGRNHEGFESSLPPCASETNNSKVVASAAGVAVVWNAILVRSSLLAVVLVIV